MPRQCVLCAEDSIEIVFNDNPVCAEHKEFHERGYVALIELNTEIISFEEDGTLLPQNVDPTGLGAMLKRDEAQRIMGLPDELMKEFVFFVDSGTIAFLKTRTVCNN